MSQSSFPNRKDVGAVEANGYGDLCACPEIDHRCSKYVKYWVDAHNDPLEELQRPAHAHPGRRMRVATTAKASGQDIWGVDR